MGMNTTSFHLQDQAVHLASTSPRIRRNTLTIDFEPSVQLPSLLAFPASVGGVAPLLMECPYLGCGPVPFSKYKSGSHAFVKRDDNTVDLSTTTTHGEA